MEREPSGRPTSVRPPSAISVPRTAALMSAAARPLTQHGLTGLKPSTAGGQRIYKDKRYYLSQLQSRNSAIREEMSRLKKLSEENKMRTLNLDDMRKKAQEAAKQIEEEQDLLAAYNIALEMHISKTKEREVVAEIEAVKRENEMKMRELDGLFTQKLKLQEKIDAMEKERVERDKAVKEMIESLPRDQKQEYFNLEQEHNSVLKQIRLVQEEINGEKEAIDKYKSMVAESSELQERFQLFQTIRKLEAQKQELTAFLSNTQTPSQQREALLQQVKNDKADIETLQKLSESLEEEVSQMEDKIAEINKELDSKDNARLKKHKELRERETHMDSFIKSYDEKAAGIRAKVEQGNNRIYSFLDQMTENLAELNLDEFGKVQMDSFDQSLDGWNKRCAALAEQKETLMRYRARFEEETNRLQAKKSEMLKEIEKMSDIEKCKEELARECAFLEDENQALEAKCESTQAAVNEATRRKVDIMRKLEANSMYHDVVNLQKEIEELENKTAEIESVIEADRNDSSLEEVAGNVRSLLNQRNEQLIAKLKAKQNK